MSGTDDRPQPRPRPRPAPTVGDPARPVGPVPAAAPTEAPAPPRGRRAQPLVQLNTRVVPLLDELVAVIVEQRGMSKREVIETALRTAYPAEYRALVEREQARERPS